VAPSLPRLSFLSLFRRGRGVRSWLDSGTPGVLLVGRFGRRLYDVSNVCLAWTVGDGAQLPRMWCSVLSRSLASMHEQGPVSKNRLKIETSRLLMSTSFINQATTAIHHSSLAIYHLPFALHDHLPIDAVHCNAKSTPHTIRRGKGRPSSGTKSEPRDLSSGETKAWLTLAPLGTFGIWRLAQQCDRSDLVTIEPGPGRFLARFPPPPPHHTHENIPPSPTSLFPARGFLVPAPSNRGDRPAWIFT